MLSELYELKEKYERELLVAEAKISVVNDLIEKEHEKEKAQSMCQAPIETPTLEDDNATEEESCQ